MLFIRRWLESTQAGTWMMIVDDVDNENAFMSETTHTGYSLFKYIPRCSQGLLLFTTRNRALAVSVAGTFTVIQVSAMTRDEARKLLISSLLPLTEVEGRVEEDMLELAEELQHLPLAISQAAAFISDGHTTVSKYLELFRNEKT